MHNLQVSIQPFFLYQTDLLAQDYDRLWRYMQNHGPVTNVISRPRVSLSLLDIKLFIKILFTFPYGGFDIGLLCIFRHYLWGQRLE